MSLFLNACPPFSLSAVVRSHGWIRLAPFREANHDGLSYVDRLKSGRVVELLIQESPGGVRVDVGGSLDKAVWDEISSKVNWMLELDQDFSSFCALAKSEPKLMGVVERAQGRLLRSPTLFEDVVKTILTTNTVWGGTIRMVDALVSQFGDPLLEEPTRHAFPTPGQLAATDEETLRSITRLGYRAPYVLELARSISAGTLDLESLKTNSLPTDQVRKRLLAIKGVGGYAVANLMMILGRYDFIPIDSWAFKMVSQEWYGGQAIGVAEVEKAFAHWGQWKGLAYWFWEWSHQPG